MMMHIINGCTVNLRGMSLEELDNLIAATRTRLERVQEELDSLMGEHIRRSNNVYQLHIEYEGPSVA